MLGKGMTTHPSVPPSLLADVFESLVAGIYLDGGDPASREFIAALSWGRRSNWPRRASWVAITSRCLQQLAQREHGSTPTYQLLDEKGPDHSKCFKIAAQIGRTRYQPPGVETRKKPSSGPRATRLSEINGEPVPFPSD